MLYPVSLRSCFRYFSPRFSSSGIERREGKESQETGNWMQAEKLIEVSETSKVANLKVRRKVLSFSGVKSPRNSGHNKDVEKCFMYILS